jgi:hypothetical protein
MKPPLLYSDGCRSKRQSLHDSQGDSNRIEWLWRGLRRTVTHNHQRETLDPLLADADQWATDLPTAAVLSQIGSPFAPDPRHAAPALPAPELTHAA